MRQSRKKGSRNGSFFATGNTTWMTYRGLVMDETNIENARTCLLIAASVPAFAASLARVAS